MQKHFTGPCQCSLRILTLSQSSCGGDANPEPDTPTKGQVFHFIPWKALMPSTSSTLYSSVPNLRFNGQQRNHKNRSKMTHLCILKNNTFYYESMHLNNTLFLPMIFTLYLVSRTLNLKSSFAGECSCYPLLGNTKGWEPSRAKERIFDLPSQ